MNKFVYIIICFTVLFYLFLSCITPFEPAGVNDTAGILVVEGIILETGTNIKLSRTVKLDERLHGSSFSHFVNEAEIHVIDEAENVVAVAEPQRNNEGVVPGAYVISEPVVFVSGMNYALDIRIGNKQYRSAFVSPVHTPEIDEISWKIDDDRSLVIMVSTHDPVDEIKYLRWAFEEDWEIRAPLFAAYRYDPLLVQIVEQDFNTSNNRFYCWSSDVSKSILLGTTDKLTEAVIKDKPIHRIPAYDSRLSYLYSILVKQYGIDKEAYTYFDILRKNVEDSGSLFGPQPTEKTGNIRCLSDPDERVIGYIAFSKETASRLFINAASLTPPDVICNEENQVLLLVSDIIIHTNNGIGIYQYDVNNSVFVGVSRKCVDCTVSGGTKNKPDFWPNNHL